MVGAVCIKYLKIDDSQELLLRIIKKLKKALIFHAIEIGQKMTVAEKNYTRRHSSNCELILFVLN